MGGSRLIRWALPLALSSACLPWIDPCREGRICTEIGTGELGFNGEGLAALETRLASPTSVTTSPDGAIVVTDYSNMLIRTLADDGTIQTIAGNGIHAYSEVGTDVLESPLENPIEAKWGPDGRLYILPQHEGRLIAVDEEGLVEIMAGTGVIADSGDGGDALDAEMGYGGGFAFGPDGSIYISDSTYSRVRHVDPDGGIRTVLGVGQSGAGEVGYGPDTAIRFPERIAIDEAGNRLLVVDSMNHRVLAMDLDSLETTIVAGTGDPGFSGDGGPAVDAQLHAPVGVEVGPGGEVLVADLQNLVIRSVNAQGTIMTIAGSGALDEPVRAASALDFPMNRPAGLAWTEDGDLLIAERSGHRILRLVGARDAL
jgi:DNA-binding beta-propeller fold protein YncE